MKISRIFLPLIVIGIGGAISALMVLAKPEAEKKEAVTTARNIRAVTAESSVVTVSVSTQGTVLAKQQINLVPQVSGQVTYTAENFVAGGNFEKGEILLRIDPRDYEYAVISATARVAESEQRLSLEKAEAALADAEWKLLGQGEASDLTLRKPQLADAKAKLEASIADLKTAQLRLERTVIRAPYNGLLTEKLADLGQYLSAGSVVGVYYSTDVLEVSLPLSNRDLGQFDLAGLKNGSTRIKVTLSGQFAEKQNTWVADIVRTEGIIDTRSRTLNVVAQLRGKQLLSIEDGTPINIGQFVAAQIEGRRYDDVIKLPREVLRQGDRVLVVDQDNKLRTRQVTVVESNRDYVVVSEGIDPGDVICKSQLGLGVDGLLVHVQLEQESQS